MNKHSNITTMLGTRFQKILSILAVITFLLLSVSGITSGSPPDIAPSRLVIDVPEIDSLEYVAIGPSRFSDVISPLIEWKTQKGVKARYFELDGESGIENVSQGRDIQEKVRNYLRELWLSNSDIKWVLLVGDGEIIPPRRTFVNGSSDNGADDNDNYVMSDMYYAGLAVDSNWEADNGWDTDNDGIFGEEDEENSDLDFKAEVYVGRFPASNNRELKIMVDRQMSYELDPPPGSWASSTLLAGALMDAPNNKELFDPYKDNAYELVRKVEDRLPDYVTPFTLLDYPRLEWGGYNRMFDTLNATSFKDHYEMGFSTALLACHGDLNGNCTDYKGDSGGKYPYWADYDVHFNYTTAETIKNGRRTPLVYISNCDSLNFTEVDDTNMERILRNPNGGAIGIIGASATTYRGEYRDETSWGNWWLAERFFEILYYTTPRPAEALYLLKEQHIYHVSQRTLHPLEERMYNIDNLAYNLLGDPEGPIWLQEPKNMNVEYPSVYYQDNNSFVVKVSDADTGEPLPGSVVALTDPGNEEIYIVTTTSQDGSSKIYFSPESLNDLRITVTRNGYIPTTEIFKVDSLINLMMLEDIRFEPEVPVRGSPLNVVAKVVNTGEIALDDIMVTIELSSPNGSQRPNKRIFHMEPGETVVVDDLSFTPYRGWNYINASVELLSESLEKRMDDNYVQTKVLVNEPVIFIGSLPNVVTLEDTRLSNLGERVNISYYVYDPDNGYPGGLSFGVSSKEENLTGEIDEKGLLDVIPGHDWSGVGYLEVSVSDGSVTIYRDLKVIVESVPDPPSFEEWPGSINGSEDQPISFRIVLRDVDSDDVNLSSPSIEDIRFERLWNESEMVYNVTMVPGEEDVGTSILTIIATDEEGETAELRISMEISTTNNPPVVTLPESVEIQPDRDIIISMDIFDPDNDLDIIVGARGSIISSYNYDGDVLTIIPVSGLEVGSKHSIEIFVDDGGIGGNRTYKMDVIVTEKGREPIFLTFVIIILVLVLILSTYGTVIRIQESRQRKLLDRVGDEAMMSVPQSRKKTGRRRIKGGVIEVPPAPADTVDRLHEEGKDHNTREKEEVSLGYRDLELDLDEIIDDIYPPGKGGNA